MREVRASSGTAYSNSPDGRMISRIPFEVPAPTHAIVPTPEPIKVNKVRACVDIAITESESVTWKFRLIDGGRVVCCGREVLDQSGKRDETLSFGTNSVVKWEPPKCVVDAAMRLVHEAISYVPLGELA